MASTDHNTFEPLWWVHIYQNLWWLFTVSCIQQCHKKLSLFWRQKNLLNMVLAIKLQVSVFSSHFIDLWSEVFCPSAVCFDCIEVAAPPPALEKNRTLSSLLAYQYCCQCFKIGLSKMNLCANNTKSSTTFSITIHFISAKALCLHCIYACKIKVKSWWIM